MTTMNIHGPAGGRITEQDMLNHLVEKLIEGRELVAGLKRIPVAYDPRDSHDEFPFADPASGDPAKGRPMDRYPVRQVYASATVPKGNVR